jgi:hypothetical protein
MSPIRKKQNGRLVDISRDSKLASLLRAAATSALSPNMLPLGAGQL